MKSYKRIQVVGKGSFGCCWLVQSDSGERCILKQIDVSKMPEKQRLEAANEVKVLSRLRHPYIINYRESYVDSGLLCIIMDFAERGDLYRMIGRKRQAKSLFAEALVLRWFTQIALALKHIHDRHILHRDLKTQNIFLAGPGDGMVKVGDFGIARVLRHTQDCARTAIGTPYYLSPEICQERPYSYKSDVWSLGCVLYELATLRHAFDAESMQGLVLKILRGVPPQVPASFSAELRSLIAEMLTKDPNCRPSVNELLHRPTVKAMIRQLLWEIEKDQRDQRPTDQGYGAGRCVSPPAKATVPRNSTPPKSSRTVTADGQEARRLKRQPQAAKSKFVRPRSASRASHAESASDGSRSPRAKRAGLRSSAVGPPHHLAASPGCAVDLSREPPGGRSPNTQPRTPESCTARPKGDQRKELIRTLEEGLGCKLSMITKEESEPTDEGSRPCFLHPGGEEIKLPVTETDSLPYRIEALRLYLEKELGIMEFLLAYKHLAESAKSDAVAAKELKAIDVHSFLSSKAISFLPLVTQLIVCEDSFY
ncbi:unnamed protein product [Durusdinium trenchii]|uniref:non-specific serine/threonine protein kinase n=1 Tax=Durusdinium trenchii TaxID=1381693 RepID=A0ABP0R9X4_9DINO